MPIDQRYKSAYVPIVNREKMTKILPDQTPKPLPTPLAMSTSPAEPTSSPIPNRRRDKSPFRPSSAESRPHPKPELPKPKIRLEIRDLSHPGTLVFISNINVTTVLTDAIAVVLEVLYAPLQSKTRLVPPVRSITLILRPLDGVAYTTGTELDDDHKEIHFSLDYISGISSSLPQRQRDEITGILVHEMVHVWQWQGLGTAPGGLIEGIADFVRLRAKLSPPHWKRESGTKWDQGYQHTAYFLEWLEVQHGEGMVSRMNEYLKEKKYEEKRFWKDLFGEEVSTLWKRYSSTWEDKEEGDESKGASMKEEVKEDNAKGDELEGENAEEAEAIADSGKGDVTEVKA